MRGKAESIETLGEKMMISDISTKLNLEPWKTVEVSGAIEPKDAISLLQQKGIKTNRFADEVIPRTVFSKQTSKITLFKCHCGILGLEELSSMRSIRGKVKSFGHQFYSVETVVYLLLAHADSLKKGAGGVFLINDQDELNYPYIMGWSMIDGNLWLQAGFDYPDFRPLLFDSSEFLIFQ